MTRTEEHISLPQFTANLSFIKYQDAIAHALSPTSSGQVERMNTMIKDKLVKTCKRTGLKWPEALNLLLWDIRNTSRQPVGVSPAEVLFGRVFAVPGTYIPAKTSLLDGDEQGTQYSLCLQKFFFFFLCNCKIMLVGIKGSYV